MFHHKMYDMRWSRTSHPKTKVQVVKLPESGVENWTRLVSNVGMIGQFQTHREYDRKLGYFQVVVANPENYHL